jgi:hypothetical protein
LTEISIALKGFVTTSFEIMMKLCELHRSISPTFGGLREFSFEPSRPVVKRSELGVDALEALASGDSGRGEAHRALGDPDQDRHEMFEVRMKLTEPAVNTCGPRVTSPETAVTLGDILITASRAAMNVIEISVILKETVVKVSGIGMERLETVTRIMRAGIKLTTANR